jgi:type IV pilus assembly protein PilE
MRELKKMSTTLAYRRYERGMTLIELLTVMAVLAILGSISVSTYRSYLLRTNRTEARTTLLRIQVAQEKYFLQNNSYTTEVGPTGLRMSGTAGDSLETPNGHYKVTLQAGSTGDIASSYSASATAQNGQTNDKAACKTLTLDDQGQKTPAESTGCWK